MRNGHKSAFTKAITQCAAEHPDNVLFSAWAYRLDVETLIQESQDVQRSQLRHWGIAILASLVLGGLYAALAGSAPPVPVPGQANPSFWIGWSPLLALGVLAFLAATYRNPERDVWSVAAGMVIILLSLATAWTNWNRTDAVAILSSIHLPFVLWAAVGGYLTLGRATTAREFSAYILKSLEAALTGGVYLLAGIASAALTVGMFAALGVTLPETLLQTIAAWGIGIIPLLAVASVYSPSKSAMHQDWTTGLARILRILTRLMLPPALGLLTVYLVWFIPLHFWRPFQEREVLIVYNVTIMAIIGLVIGAVPGPDERLLARYETLLRYGALATSVLTLVLNAYALAAIASRTFGHGLTPNRHAVFGWNIVTLIVLTVLIMRLWRATSHTWADLLHRSIGRVMLLPIVWTLWVLFGLPHF